VKLKDVISEIEYYKKELLEKMRDIKVENEVDRIFKKYFEEIVKSQIGLYFDNLRNRIENQILLYEDIDSFVERLKVSKEESMGKQNDIFEQAYQRGYERGVRLVKLQAITIMLIENKYEDNFIARVIESTEEKIELVRIEIRIFQSGEDINYVMKYTKFKYEEAETIKNHILN
jgi:hypothetical protein